MPLSTQWLKEKVSYFISNILANPFVITFKTYLRFCHHLHGYQLCSGFNESDPCKSPIISSLNSTCICWLINRADEFKFKELVYELKVDGRHYHFVSNYIFVSESYLKICSILLPHLFISVLFFASSSFILFLFSSIDFPLTYIIPL